MPVLINELLKKELNTLARLFYHAKGNEVKEGYDFSKAKTPKEIMCYEMAKISYDYWSEILCEEESN